MRQPQYWHNFVGMSSLPQNYIWYPTYIAVPISSGRLGHDSRGDRNLSLEICLSSVPGDRDRKPATPGGQPHSEANRAPSQVTGQPVQRARAQTPSQPRLDPSKSRDGQGDLSDLQRRPELACGNASSGSRGPPPGDQADTGSLPILTQKLAVGGGPRKDQRK